jgi:hypothetical protein
MAVIATCFVIGNLQCHVCNLYPWPLPYEHAKVLRRRSWNVYELGSAVTG